LCHQNPNWKEQTEIDNKRVDMRTAMLFHYNLDLSAVHRKLDGNHVGAQRDPEFILRQVSGLIDQKTFDHLRRILVDGCPGVFNEEATYAQYLEMHQYGNHKSVEQNLEKVMLTMNKEDRKDHVLTFPAWLAEFIPDLMLTAQGFVMLPGKNDRLVFDASFILSLLSRPFNHLIDMNDEPDYFRRSLEKVSHLDLQFESGLPQFGDIPFRRQRDSRISAAQVSPECNQWKSKYLFIPTGLTFGDCSSPPSWEPFAQARMALSTELSRGFQSVPAYSDYMEKVTFAPPPPPGTTFARDHTLGRFQSASTIPHARRRLSVRRGG
jgi:hypothetical protein